MDQKSHRKTHRKWHRKQHPKLLQFLLLKKCLKWQLIQVSISKLGFGSIFGVIFCAIFFLLNWAPGLRSRGRCTCTVLAISLQADRGGGTERRQPPGRARPPRPLHGDAQAEGARARRAGQAGRHRRRSPGRRILNAVVTTHTVRSPHHQETKSSKWEVTSPPED